MNGNANAAAHAQAAELQAHRRELRGMIFKHFKTSLRSQSTSLKSSITSWRDNDRTITRAMKPTISRGHVVINNLRDDIARVDQDIDATVDNLLDTLQANHSDDLCSALEIIQRLRDLNSSTLTLVSELKYGTLLAFKHQADAHATDVENRRHEISSYIEQVDLLLDLASSSTLAKCTEENIYGSLVAGARDFLLRGGAIRITWSTASIRNFLIWGIVCLLCTTFVTTVLLAAFASIFPSFAIFVAHGILYFAGHRFGL